MKLRLVFLGRTRGAEYQALIGHYCERIRHFHPLEVVERKSTAAGPEVVAELKGGKQNANLVLLDAGGKAFTSEQFAGWLGRQIESSARQLVFVVGGAEGFPDESKRAADLSISLSPMTYAHELARVMVAEQIYRAFSILRNHPYSK